MLPLPSPSLCGPDVFAVELLDIEKAKVRGLKGLEYLDKVSALKSTCISGTKALCKTSQLHACLLACMRTSD